MITWDHEFQFGIRSSKAANRTPTAMKAAVFCEVSAVEDDVHGWKRLVVMLVAPVDVWGAVGLSIS